MQTKLSSLTESIINVFIGYVVAILTQITIFPLFGIYTTFSDDLAIGAIFTVISLARSYCIRRMFNMITNK